MRASASGSPLTDPLSPQNGMSFVDGRGDRASTPEEGRKPSLVLLDVDGPRFDALFVERVGSLGSEASDPAPH